MKVDKRRAVRTVDKDTKKLFIDIETSFLIAAVWGMWQVNVGKLLQDFYILSVAYQWEGGEMQFMRSYGSGKDRAICRKLHKLFNEADIIVAQNGDSFDVKKINARMAFWGFPPPDPYKTVDTLKILKKNFGLTRNSLDFACEYFKIGRKIKHQGIDLWHNCMQDANHPDWEIMEKYNKHDVQLLVRLYDKIRPWHKFHPLTGNKCPKCGNKNGQWRGKSPFRGIFYRRWSCFACLKWSRTDIKWRKPVL